MRYRVLTLLTLMAVAAAIPAGAQALPERVRTAVRERVDLSRTVARYQQGREEQTDRQTKTFRIGADGELSVANIAGDIVVTRSGGSEATVEIVKTARARTADEARQMLELVDVTATERNGRAEVKTNYPRGDEMRRENRRNINVSVAYTITAPAGTRLTVGSVSGSIRVADIKGDLTLNTISGTVRVANAGRIGTAKSISGNVEIVDTKIDDAIEADSISGNVTLRNVNARRFALGSVSGSVMMQDVQCERLEAHSISGNVEYSGGLVKNGRYELQSHSGDVRVSIASGSGFELDANTFSGTLRSDISIKMDSLDSDGRGRKRALHGISGDGSAVLDITTFSGNVILTKR